MPIKDCCPGQRQTGGDIKKLWENVTVSAVIGSYWPLATKEFTSLIHEMQMNQRIFNIPFNSKALANEKGENKFITNINNKHLEACIENDSCGISGLSIQKYRTQGEGLSLYEGYKCLIIMLLCKPETNVK